jgi:hypothetical protein
MQLFSSDVFTWVLTIIHVLYLSITWEEKYLLPISKFYMTGIEYNIVLWWLKKRLFWSQLYTCLIRQVPYI